MPVMKKLLVRPGERGLRAGLFDLEADIMEVVWSKGWERFSVGAVHGELERAREIAYTTVMTTVVRLHDKGLLERHRDGRRYLYRPKLSRHDFLQRMASEVLDSLGPIGSDAAMALLVDRVQQTDEEDLDRLEALIQARRKELDRA
jgi:predicted transcriptional regulator